MPLGRGLRPLFCVGIDRQASQRAEAVLAEEAPAPVYDENGALAPSNGEPNAEPFEVI